MRSLPSWRLILLAALVLAPPAVQAQTVDEIVAKNIEAKGGFDTLKSTNTVRTVGTGTMQGATVTIKTLTKRPSFARNEMTVAGQTNLVGFDGERAWMAVGGMPAQPMPPGPQTEGLKQNSHIDSPLFDYKSKGTTITFGEPAMVTEGDRKLHHLLVTPKGGAPMHYYIDAATGLEDRMVIEVDDPGQKMKMELRFLDFKTVAGRTVPFTIRQFVNGTQMLEMKFEQIEFNVPADDSLFQMPKGGQPRS